METKDQLIQTIRKWVQIDNDIRALQKEQVQRKNEKKKLSNDLMEVMRKNEIDCVDLKDGQLIYTKKSVKKPLTQKMLLSVLSSYYDGNALKASELSNFIMDNREEVIKESIMRKIDKPLESSS